MSVNPCSWWRGDIRESVMPGEMHKVMIQDMGTLFAYLNIRFQNKICERDNALKYCLLYLRLLIFLYILHKFWWFFFNGDLTVLKRARNWISTLKTHEAIIVDICEAGCRNILYVTLWWTRPEASASLFWLLLQDQFSPLLIMSQLYPFPCSPARLMSPPICVSVYMSLDLWIHNHVVRKDGR